MRTHAHSRLFLPLRAHAQQAFVPLSQVQVLVDAIRRGDDDEIGTQLRNVAAEVETRNGSCSGAPM